MDVKTLEYMGERVDKARRLQKAIKEVEWKIGSLKATAVPYIQFDNPKGGYIHIGQKYMDLPDNSIVSRIKETTISLLEAYRDSLQKELDEL